MSQLHSRAVRSVYLITYSQADFDKVPTRERFCELVLEAFRSETLATPLQWVCGQEAHEGGGFHFHLAIKLDRQQRWLAVRDYLDRQHHVKVNFSNVHTNYYTAFCYATKEDQAFLMSEDHPDLSNGPPRTMAASQARTQEINGRQSQQKRKRLTPYEVSVIVTSKAIKQPLELMALAKIQRDEGKDDLYEFIITKGRKKVEELINACWEVETAPEVLQRSRLQRLTILEGALEEECVCDTSEGASTWYDQALEILANNFLQKEVFAKAVYDLLHDGRGKYKNIMITGPANCGKSFLVGPLTKIFQTFKNPAVSSFAWVGAEDAEVIILNDFRWNQQIIAWNDFLLLLEGEPVHLPAPKSHYAKDILLTKDTPIFCTSSHQIMMIRGGVVDERETEMMAVRWRHFPLFYQIPAEAQRDISPCPSCFAQLILHNVPRLL